MIYDRSRNRFQKWRPCLLVLLFEAMIYLGDNRVLRSITGVKLHSHVSTDGVSPVTCVSSCDHVIKGFWNFTSGTGTRLLAVSVTST